MEISISTTVQFGIEECCACGVRFGLPLQLQKNLRETHARFYCPNGHGQSYFGETEAEKLRKELKRKEQELADKSIQKIQLESELDKANKKLKRVHNGTCPCCKRSFANLQKHMQTKHPEMVK